ncbi:PIG-L deacetylase family protein [Desulfohalovibrio reitneri]|uniref:PIG-L deacetylase family protein n=1 Tax=Desulfohalovibrio reitneri TaxID=1307759 RepID=UPI0004A7722E|nr:PIG-L deacetylase family protein [Desulfohalovibrio reitneri]
MRVLVAAAHPDDEVLGCGATMARLAAQGHEVRTLICSGGVASRFDAPPQDLAERLAAQRNCARDAAGELGVEAPLFLDFPDNQFDSRPLLELVKAVSEVIDDYAPDSVFTHHGGDLNVDHSALFRAVLTAARPMRGCPVKDIYSFEVPSSTEWSFGKVERPFVPSVYFDAGETLEAKVRAMARYEAEARPHPHPRSPEALRALALRRGSETGLDAAEAFELIRSVR